MLEETLVFDGQNGEVAIVTDVFDFGDVRTRILKTAHDDLLAPAYDMGIGHDSFAFDDEPGSSRALHGIKSPGSIPDGLLHESGNLNHRAFGVGGAAADSPSANEGND